MTSEVDQAKANQQETATMEVVVIDDPDKTSVPNILGNTTIAMISHQTEDEVASENTKTIQPFTSCYSNDSDFSIMLTTFWPSIQLYVKNNPEHEHSKQWPQWMSQGLNQYSKYAFFKSILGTETLDQLYRFFRD